MHMNDDQLLRYSRHILLDQIGIAGQEKLLAAHALIIGAGGLGSPVALYLAAAGVGTISVVDDDTVALSNLQRQILYSDRDIGTAKVDAAGAAAVRLNPDITFNAIPQRIGKDASADILAGVDVVIDGSDNFTTRLIVNDLCLAAKVPLVSAAIGQFHGQIGTFTGWQADAPCYRCFVGDAHDPDDCDDCATQGVLGAMCGLMGSFAAMEAIRALTGFGEPQQGRLHLFDGLTPSMRSIKLPKDPACSSCGGLTA
jgi:adenylyltransferase/sulfurtransferase